MCLWIFLQPVVLLSFYSSLCISFNHTSNRKTFISITDKNKSCYSVPMQGVATLTKHRVHPQKMMKWVAHLLFNFLIHAVV